MITLLHGKNRNFRTRQLLLPTKLSSPIFKFYVHNSFVVLGIKMCVLLKTTRFSNIPLYRNGYIFCIL